MSDGWLEKPTSEAGNLHEQDRELLRRLFASPADFPTEFKAWLVDYITQEVIPAIFAAQIKGRTDGSAPKESAYVVLAHDSALTAERLLAAGSGISIIDGGADGTVTIAATGGGGAGGMIFLPGDTPEDIDIPIILPGAPGAAGAAGAAGAQGIPGVMGMAGLDADDPEIPVWLPGKDAVKGLFAIWEAGTFPTATGQTGGIWRVPYVNGVSKTFNIDRITFRVETAVVSGTYTVSVEKSPGGGAFSATVIQALSLTSAAVETSATSSLGQVTSGQLLRINFTSFGVGAASYTVQLEGTATP